MYMASKADCAPRDLLESAFKKEVRDMELYKDVILLCNQCEKIESVPFDIGDKCLCGGTYDALYRAGDTLQDENGNTGQVVIQWNDGDHCHFLNDTKHKNPVVMGNIND